MTIPALQNLVIEKVNNTDDENLLMEVFGILDSSPHPEVYQLSSAQKAAIQEGILQADSGQLIDDAIVKKEEDKGLNE